MRSQYVPPLIQLAPMEGVLDGILRELLDEVGGVDRMVTEFVRVTDKLLPPSVFYKYCPELLNGGRTRMGTPVFVQLLGGQPNPMAENAARAAELGALGVDLNFGCPAKTVNRHDGGAVLLATPQRLYEITRAVRAAVPEDKPVTAKVRLGFLHKELCREIAVAVQEGGASHLVVHARTKLEMYTPPAHWAYIHQMSEGLQMPFLVNGEIWSSADYWRAVEESGVERVALGRGLVARPTLALEILASRKRRQQGLPVEEPRPFNNHAFLIKFFSRSLEQKGPGFAIGRLKQILRYWSRDARLASWFQMAKRISNPTEALEFFESLQRSDEWSKFKCTPGRTAPIASAPSNF